MTDKGVHASLKIEMLMFVRAVIRKSGAAEEIGKGMSGVVGAVGRVMVDGGGKTSGEGGVAAIDIARYERRE